MRKLILAILAVLAAFSCRERPEPFCTGDLVFVALPLRTVSGEDSTQTTLIHVGILDVDQLDSLWIVDVTLKHGVMRDPLDTFFRDFTRSNGKLPEMIVMRLKDTSHVKEYVQNAKSYIGQPYDFDFLPDNGALYCSELVYDSYVKPDGTHIFQEVPIDLTDGSGEIGPYWVRLFERIHYPVPQGKMGTTPESLLESEELRPVNNSLVK